MRTIVDNLAVEYTDEGQGPVVLMLHGWADSLHTFDPILRYVSKYRIVRVDLPGFGGSERPTGVWGVQEYVDFVAQFCQKLQVRPSVLIGHSFGGRIIIKGVGSGALSVGKIILVASAGVEKKRTAKNEIYRIIAKVGKAITLIPPFSFYRQQLRKRLYRSVGRDYFAAGSMRDTFLKVIGEDLLQYASNIQIPTLLIWGRDDTSTPLADGEKIHAAIHGSQLEILDGSHFIHQEKPHEVAELIKRFV